MPALGLRMANNGLSQLVAFGVLLLIFYYSSVLFWQVVYPREFKFPVALSVPEKAKRVVDKPWNWFVDTATVAKPVQHKPTKLNAKLIGVIAQGGEGQGIALIAVKGKPAQLFHVGDEIVPAVYLQSVGAYYVNLERDGAIEVLELKRANLFKGDAPDQDGADEQGSEGMSKEEFRKIMREKPIELAQMIAFEKVKSPGGAGFRVSPKEEKHKDLFYSLGLMEGDIIVAANNQKILGLATKPKAWKSLLNAKNINLKIVRDGVTTEVVID